MLYCQTSITKAKVAANLGSYDHIWCHATELETSLLDISETKAGTNISPKTWQYFRSELSNYKLAQVHNNTYEGGGKSHLNQTTSCLIT